MAIITISFLPLHAICSISVLFFGGASVCDARWWFFHGVAPFCTVKTVCSVQKHHAQILAFWAWICALGFGTETTGFTMLLALPSLFSQRRASRCFPWPGAALTDCSATASHMLRQCLLFCNGFAYCFLPLAAWVACFCEQIPSDGQSSRIHIHPCVVAK